MSDNEGTCPFCKRLASDDIMVEGDLAVAFPDAFPVNPGHTLVVPRRHEIDYFALSEAEHIAMWQLIHDVRQRIEAELKPDGYNIGVNAGSAAGQTVDHAHLHIIPRYRSDADDPRGGVRWILPARARYWDK